MSSWDDYRLTCVHGRREGVDSHDCSECDAIAKKLGWKPSPSGYMITDATYKKLKPELEALEQS